jgi:hypothetical protein
MQIAGLKEINAVSEIVIALERKIMQLPFSDFIEEAMEKVAVESIESVEWERTISGEFYYYKGNFMFRSIPKLAIIILKYFGKISLAGKIASKDNVISYLEKELRKMNIEKYNFEAKLKKNNEYYRKKIEALSHLINEYSEALKMAKRMRKERIKKEMLSRLNKVYSELKDTNPIKFKDIAALGFGSNTVYNILYWLERKGIAKREGKEYIIDWNKFKEYISKEAI